MSAIGMPGTADRAAGHRLSRRPAGRRIPSRVQGRQAVGGGDICGWPAKRTARRIRPRRQGRLRDGLHSL